MEVSEETVDIVAVIDCPTGVLIEIESSPVISPLSQTPIKDEFCLSFDHLFSIRKTLKSCHLSKSSDSEDCNILNEEYELIDSSSEDDSRVFVEEGDLKTTKCISFESMGLNAKEMDEIHEEANKVVEKIKHRIRLNFSDEEALNFSSQEIPSFLVNNSCDQKFGSTFTMNESLPGILEMNETFATSTPAVKHPSSAKILVDVGDSYTIDEKIPEYQLNSTVTIETNQDEDTSFEIPPRKVLFDETVVKDENNTFILPQIVAAEENKFASPNPKPIEKQTLRKIPTRSESSSSLSSISSTSSVDFKPLGKSFQKTRIYQHNKLQNNAGTKPKTSGSIAGAKTKTIGRITAHQTSGEKTFGMQKKPLQKIPMPLKKSQSVRERELPAKGQNVVNQPNVPSKRTGQSVPRSSQTATESSYKENLKTNKTSKSSLSHKETDFNSEKTPLAETTNQELIFDSPQTLVQKKLLPSKPQEKEAAKKVMTKTSKIAQPLNVKIQKGLTNKRKYQLK